MRRKLNVRQYEAKKRIGEVKKNAQSLKENYLKFREWEMKGIQIKRDWEEKNSNDDERKNI